MIPARACDCHVHVVGDPSIYPMLSDRPYTPGIATVDDLRTHLSRIGFQRAVIVQPSIYGTDNQCLVKALQDMRGEGRGIAVLDADVPHDELLRLDRAGVRGVRLNLESYGMRDPSEIQAKLTMWARRIADLGWHIQVYAAWPVIQASLPWLGTLPAPVVIDHFGLLPLGDSRDRNIALLADALGKDGLYVKLSGSYRVPGADPHSLKQLATALIAANIDRVIWASDWPHTNREPGKAATEISAFRAVEARDLIAELTDWLPDADTARRVLEENPERLYRF